MYLQFQHMRARDKRIIAKDQLGLHKDSGVASGNSGPFFNDNNINNNNKVSDI